MILPSEEKKQNLRGKKAKPCGSSFDAEFEKKEKERKKEPADVEEADRC